MGNRLYKIRYKVDGKGKGTDFDVYRKETVKRWWGYDTYWRYVKNYRCREHAEQFIIGVTEGEPREDFYDQYGKKEYNGWA